VANNINDFQNDKLFNVMLGLTRNFIDLSLFTIDHSPIVRLRRSLA